LFAFHSRTKRTGNFEFFFPGGYPPLTRAEHRMQQLIRCTMEEIVSDARAAPVDVWHNLLEECEKHWRNDADGLLGVMGVDLPVGVCLLVKQRGMSVLRLAINTELDFHRLMLEAEIDSDLRYSVYLLCWYKRPNTDAAHPHQQHAPRRARRLPVACVQGAGVDGVSGSGGRSVLAAHAVEGR